ncbi:LytR/AlgR family response regulator transcription factor [Alloscardovia venturai]|uniref:LytR/AlgR family response regulator transcription factor n=1 Tax=Alloscardovia venturai TaxID=1769421 RepID=A0ABW2Y5C1_9BIFI
MFRIALVEDTYQDAQATDAAIERYMSQENGISYTVERYTNAQAFLDAALSHNFDIIFMDIEMPGGCGDGMDGMSAAAKYREQSASHNDSILIFTTKVAQLAARGYEVSAVGYLIKPFDYATFAMTMKRAMTHAYARSREVTLTVPSSGGTHFVSSKDVVYMEVRDHMVFIHLNDGTTQTMWGTLKDFAAQLENVNFVQCNRYALVNLHYVTGFAERELMLTDACAHEFHVEMSRNKKAHVLDTLLAAKSAQ